MSPVRIVPTASPLPAFSAIAICLGMCLAAGCAQHGPVPPVPDPDEGARTDQQVISSVRDAAVANAIVAQHTMFPYHFLANSKDLNELGERDLAVLADFYRANPGDLNIRRGDIPAPIYDARVRAVQSALARAGVDAARVNLGEAPPGGPGMPTEDVIHILQMNWKDAGKGYEGAGGGAGVGASSASGGGTGTGGGSSSSGGGMK